MRALALIAALGLASSATASANPLAKAAKESLTRDGVVAERVPAGSYTYLRIADAEPFWIATMGTGPAPGTPVTVNSFARTSDFHSKRLDRRFATLHFGVVTAR